jgi:hypothetical protein
MKLLPAFLPLVLAFTPLLAQAKIAILGGQGQRNNTAVVLADTSSGGFKPLALVTITYGVPEWKPDYAEKVDTLTKGHLFRLGRDNWPIFDSNVAVKFGDVTVPAGTYYLGIARSKDGAIWNLVFIDPAKAKAANAWPPAPESAPHAFDVPLTHAKTEGKIVEKLDVNMVNDAAQPTHGTLTIAWGDRKLTGSYDMILGAAQPKDAAGTKEAATKGK